MTQASNVLLITSDQQHWMTLGINNPEIQTPNLDRLAAGGMNFTRAYTVTPPCTPPRASLLTGSYPSQHGAYSLGTKLDDAHPTIGATLSEAGYHTALIGKAHFQPLKGTEEYPSLEAYPVLQDLEFWRTFDRPFYGFDHVELARNHTAEAHVGQHYALWLEEKGCTNWRDYFQTPTGTNDSQDLHWDIPEEFHYDAWIAERTEARLRECAAAGTPFYIWASFFDPHPQYLVPSPWDTMYDPDKLTVPHITEGEHDTNPPHFGMTREEDPDFSAYQEPEGNAMHGFHSHRHDPKRLSKEIAVYYGMVSLMDKYIGKILDTLDELGLTESTLVVFTTDHGHFYGQHGLIAKGPFHYEDMVKVPLIASMPGTIPAGHSCEALQSLVDLPPTMLDFLGQAVPRFMTGLSQKAVWGGKAARIRDNVIVENRHQPTTVFHRSLINDRYKLTVYYKQPYGELFDLRDDPGEVHNRWDDPAAQSLKSALLLELMHATMGAEPLPMPRIAGA